MLLDIYGTSSVKAPVVAAVKPTLQPLEPEKPLTLIPCDTIASYGSIRSMVVGLVNEEVRRASLVSSEQY